MLAMPGMRAFSLAAKRGGESVSCDADGVFVGGVPLLQSPGASNPYWSVRPAAELNKELTVRYRLPIDIASKVSALALIAAALNRGDLAMAAIAAVQMQFPDPPLLAKRAENPDEITRRARDLARSGLLKFWDPALHPRAGVPPNPGWFAPAAGDPEPAEAIPPAVPPKPGGFTLVGDKPEPLDPIPDITIGNPADKPWEERPPTEGGGDEDILPGIVELPLPGGSPGNSAPSASSPSEAPPRPWTIPDPKSKLPFMSETEPQLAPYKDGKTSGIFWAPNVPPVELQSGYYGPTLNRPDDSADFDVVTMTHVEGHAAALMRQFGISEAWLSINNPEICESCLRDLEAKMLPPGTTLHVILPDGSEKAFKGEQR